MYVRLGFAVAINVDPDILLVDEVLAVGDEAFQRRCEERFAQFRGPGPPGLFVQIGNAAGGGGGWPGWGGGGVPSREEDAEAGFDPNTVFAPKDQRKVDRFILFGLAAAQEALAQAKWAPVSEADRLRTATIIASGIGGFPAITEAVRTVDRRGVRRLSPFTVPSFLVNLRSRLNPVLSDHQVGASIECFRLIT